VACHAEILFLEDKDREGFLELWARPHGSEFREDLLDEFKRCTDETEGRNRNKFGSSSEENGSFVD
jgi:hypothetical protein